MRGVARFLRRDRLTGQIAVSAVGVLCAGAVVFGVGMSSAKYRLADVGSWLPSTKKGNVVHVNGLSGKVDGKVQLNGSAGHPMKVIQQNGVVLIVDETTGVVSRIDPAKLNVTQAQYRAAAGVQVVSANGVAYAMDPRTGTVQRMDPMTLTNIGGPFALTPPLSTGGIDATAALWVPVPADGQAARVPNGGSTQLMGVGGAGDDLALTLAQGMAVVTDFTAARSVIVGSAGTQVRVNLPPAVARVGRGGVLAPSSTDGSIVPLLVPRTGELMLLNTAAGGLATATLRVPTDHRLTAPQMLGQRVYVPDESAGRLIVYNTATNHRENDVVVTGRPGPLDVYVKDGLLWANSPDTSKAVVVDGTGGVKPVSKYSGNVPAGDKNPVPKVGGDPGQGGSDQGDPGGDSGSGDRPPRLLPTSPPGHDRPPATTPGAPQPAGNVTASGRDGGVDVRFEESPSGNVTYYTLDSRPAFPGADGMKVQPGDTPGFSLKGGDCGTLYRFRVLAHWKDAGGRDRTVSSDDAQARPCVSPGQVTGLRATPSSGGHGGNITWKRPANAGKSTTYKVTCTGGPDCGPVRTGTGTNLTWFGLQNGNTYTFGVTAKNGAGTSTSASTRMDLTPPRRTYNGHNNEATVTYLHTGPSTSAPRAGQFAKGFTGAVTVLCQEQGSAVTDPQDTSLKSSVWTKIDYGGVKWVSDLYVTTPNSNAGRFSDPDVWRCT